MFQKELEQFISTIASSKYHIDLSQLAIEIYHNPGDITEGLSDAPLFFVKHLNKPLFVVKAFIQEQTIFFASLMKGCDFLSQQSLKESKLILPIAQVFHVKEGIEVALVAFEAASGKSLNVYFKEAAGDTESIKIIAQAYENVGRALAEINLINYSPKNSVSDFFWEKDLTIFNEFLEVTFINPSLVNADMHLLKQNFEKLFSLIRETPIPAGIIHGDAHPGNLFYDPTLNKLMITDLDRLAFSISPHGLPSAPLAFEYVFTLLSMQFAARVNQLAQTHIDSIATSFINCYKENMRDCFPSDKIIQYYRSLFWMRKIFLIGTAAENLSPMMRKQIEIQRQMAQESLKQDLL